jgi:hypothetical protein
MIGTLQPVLDSAVSAARIPRSMPLEYSDRTAFRSSIDQVAPWLPAPHRYPPISYPETSIGTIEPREPSTAERLPRPDNDPTRDTRLILSN